jgi:uncharacterized membrane protein
VSVRKYKSTVVNTVVAILVGAVLVTAHLGLGVAIVQAATRWMGWLAIGVALVLLVLVHVVGFRRLVSRRSRAPHTDGDLLDREGGGVHDSGSRTSAGPPST